MVTFDITGKAFDEIETPKPLPVAPYGMRLTKPAYLERNKNDNGENCILELEVFGESDPDHNGRPFMIWMSLPSHETEDFSRKTRRGGTVADFKMSQIEKNVRALGGTIEGSSFTIPEDAMCKANVIQRINPEDPEDIWNEISGILMPYTI